jgi:hypothetical protein
MAQKTQKKYSWSCKQIINKKQALMIINKNKKENKASNQEHNTSFSTRTIKEEPRSKEKKKDIN